MSDMDPDKHQAHNRDRRDESHGFAPRHGACDAMSDVTLPCVQTIGDPIFLGRKGRYYLVQFTDEGASLSLSSLALVTGPQNNFELHRLDGLSPEDIEFIKGEFERSQPEHFESYFCFTLKARKVESRSSEGDGRKDVQFYDVCPTDSRQVACHINSNGAVIKVIEDLESGNRNIVIAPREEANVEELILQISSEKWDDTVLDLVEQLANSNGEHTRKVICNLGRYESRSYIFNTDRSPTSVILNDILTSTRLGDLGLHIIRGVSNSFSEAAVRLLEARDSVMIRFADMQTVPSRWKKMFLTFGDHGSGSVVLCLGNKTAPDRVGPDGGDSPGLGRARFDLQLSALEESDKRAFLTQVIEAFSRSRDEFPGQIGKFLLEKKSDSSGLVCSSWCKGMKFEHLDAARSLAYFNVLVSSAFKVVEVPLKEVYRDGGRVVLEALNKSGARLYLTIMPHGIEKIVVAPSEADQARSVGASFALGNHYQLDEGFRKVVFQIALLFSGENERETIFRDTEGKIIALSAQATAHYLNGFMTPVSESGDSKSLPPKFKIEEILESKDS